MKTLEEYLKGRYTAKTAKAYKREIEIYLSNNPAAEKARHQDILNYIGKLRVRYPNPKTLSRILSSIKAYYDFLSSTGKRKDNPAKSIRLRDKQSKDIQLQDLFTTEELEGLLNRKERYNALEYRNKVLMSLLIYQALKPEEIAQLTVNEINLSRATVYIRGSGKNNSRELTLKPTQIILFHHYQTAIRPRLLKDNQSDIFLISHRQHPMKGEDITKHVKRSFRTFYSPRKVNCQTIRQSVITNLLSAGNDLRLVQVFAGHKYPSTTEKYKQTNVEALKSAIQSYHPIR